MIILGLGGQTKDALSDLVASYSKDKLFFYTDFMSDTSIPFFESKKLNVCVGSESLINYFKSYDRNFISFLGNNFEREKMVAKTIALGGIPHYFISKFSNINLEFVKLSHVNTIIMDNSHISANSEIKEGAIIYTHTSIAHDVIIGKYAFISAYCAISNSEIGDYTFIGLNTMIGPGVKIGKNCIVGANSYVKNDLPDGVIAAGSPAKIIKYVNEH